MCVFFLNSISSPTSLSRDDLALRKAMESRGSRTLLTMLVPVGDRDGGSAELVGVMRRYRNQAPCK